MNYWVFAVLLLTVTAVSGCAKTAGVSGDDLGIPDIPDIPSPPPIDSCSVIPTMDFILSTYVSPVDFSIGLRNSHGKTYSFSSGSETLNTEYDSASTAKWVTATVILRLVDQGDLSLNDRPVDILGAGDWPIPGSDSLDSMTLEHLLSFTSGLIDNPICLANKFKNFWDCILILATSHIGNGEIPGDVFNYGSSHLQVAGAMAVRASASADWGEVFGDFKTATGLFPSAVYDIPGTGNPLLAGGMTWKGNEYLEFLDDYRTGLILDPATQAIQMSDHVTVVGNSPARDSLNLDWHYGLGMWIECENDPFDCTTPVSYSSPGKYGSYPFLNTTLGLTGLVALYKEEDGFPVGYGVFKAIESRLPAFADCLLD